MKFLFSLVVVVALIVGTEGQKHRGGKGGKNKASAESASGEEPAEVLLPNVTSANFNTTDKTLFSRRQWMEIAIGQFFDDFEAGITYNAPYLFAPGAPYVSNGALYMGLDMSDPRTWQVIPKKTRTEREYSPYNRTETWVRSLNTYPDGHQTIEFASFTFDNKGMMTVLSKVESKDCGVAVATPASSMYVAPAKSNPLRPDSKSVPDVSGMAAIAPTAKAPATKAAAPTAKVTTPAPKPADATIATNATAAGKAGKAGKAQGR